jgi:hypothetical protein
MTKIKSVIDELPNEMLVTQGNQKFIKYAGLQFLVDQIGVFKCRLRDVTIDYNKEIIYECEGYLVPSMSYLKSKDIDPATYPPELLKMLELPVITRGTSSDLNTKENLRKYKVEMASTRAVVRCMRLISGCPYTGVDELPDSDTAMTTYKKIGSSMSIKSATDILKDENAMLPREQCLNIIDDMKSKNVSIAKELVKYLDSVGAGMKSNLTDAQLNEFVRKITTQ